MTTPTTWRKVQLGSLGDFRNGVNFGKDKKGEGIRLINVKDIFSDIPKINFESLDKVALADQKGIEKYYVQARDLFFVRSSVKRDGVGLVSMASKSDDETVHCGFVIRLRLNNPDVDPQFLTYILRSPLYRKTIIGISSGVAITNISQDSLSSMSVDLPPLPTQRKIASILSAYDGLIENNTRRIKILEEMAQALYREWFVKFRFPGHEKVKMVESELGMVPEGWEVKRLEDVCLRITDGSHWSPKTVDDGYPMASVKDMNEWGFEISQCRKIAKEDYEELIRNDCKPLKGDVLIAKDGSYLKHIFVTEKELELVILSSIAIIRPNNQILSHVLSLYLREPSVKDRMAGYVSGVALPRIVLKDFRKLLIIVPDIDLQKQFFNLAEPMIKNCYRLIEKNANLRRTRDLLLPKLISGEVNVINLSHIKEVSEV